MVGNLNLLFQMHCEDKRSANAKIKSWFEMLGPRSQFPFISVLNWNCRVLQNAKYKDHQVYFIDVITYPFTLILSTIWFSIAYMHTHAKHILAAWALNGKYHKINMVLWTLLITSIFHTWRPQLDVKCYENNQ